MIVDHPSAAPSRTHTHCDVSSTVTQYNTVLLLCYCIMYIWEPAFEAGHGVEVFVNMGLQG